MKKTTSLVWMTRVGILSITLIISAFLNYSYGQYIVDGENCVGGNLEWPTTADAVDADGDPGNVPASANIQRLWFDVDADTLYFAFTRESTTTGNAGYALFFNADCDASTGESATGGAEIAMYFNISSGALINVTDVYYWTSASTSGNNWTSQSINFNAALGDSTCGATNRNFFEFNIGVADLLPDVCRIGDVNCGSIELTIAETYAGASFNSSQKDVMDIGLDAFINDAPVASIDIDPTPVCSGTPVTISGHLSTENTNVNTSYDTVVNYFWEYQDNDDDFDDALTQSFTNTFYGTGSFNVKLIVEDRFGCFDTTDNGTVYYQPGPTAYALVTIDSSGSKWRCEDFEFRYRDDNSVDYNGDPVASYYWLLPDSFESTSDDFYHSYAHCLWASDGNGGTYYGQVDAVYVVTDSFGCSNQTAVAVPVDLIYFKGEVLDGAALLKWQTGSEENSEYFAVERSTNGEQFEEIGRVEASGNSVALNGYTYMDVEMPKGTVYYRLTQYDYNGAFETYAPIALSTVEEGRIHVTPNPTVDHVTVSLPAGTTGGDLVILDLAGKEVYRETIQSSMNQSSTDINVSHLPKGIYYVRFGNVREGYTSQLLQLL